MNNLVTIFFAKPWLSRGRERAACIYISRCEEAYMYTYINENAILIIFSVFQAFIHSLREFIFWGQLTKTRIDENEKFHLHGFNKSLPFTHSSFSLLLLFCSFPLLHHFNIFIIFIIFIFIIVIIIMKPHCYLSFHLQGCSNDLFLSLSSFFKPTNYQDK